MSPFVSRYVTRKIRIYGRVNEVCWDTLRRAYLLSGMDCGGARGEELLWACVFLCAWQRTSCISPEQRRAHTPTSAVALTNLGLTWPSSPTSLLKSRTNWRNKRRMKRVRECHWFAPNARWRLCCAHTHVRIYVRSLSFWCHLRNACVGGLLCSCGQWLTCMCLVMCC